MFRVTQKSKEIKQYFIRRAFPPLTLLVLIVAVTVLVVAVASVRSPVSVSSPSLLQKKGKKEGTHLSIHMALTEKTQHSIQNKQKTYIQPRIPRHSPLHPNPHPLNHRQQNPTPNRRVPRLLPPTPNRQTAPREKPRDDRIVRVFLLSYPLDSAIKGREETAPDTEITAEDGRAGFDGGEGADAAFAVGGVAEAFDGVPEGAADSLGWELGLSVVGRAEGKRGVWGPEGWERLTPMQKAPPKSDAITQGQGSRV